jgi:hypothetical protein
LRDLSITITARQPLSAIAVKHEGFAMKRRRRHPILRSCGRLWRIHTPGKIAFLIFLELVSLLSPPLIYAGSIRNTGQINNNGTFRVKNNTQGAMTSVNGVFDFNGVDQTVAAWNFNNLYITGSGTKTTVGGDFTVSNNLIIDPTAILKVESGKILTLGGTLTENGVFKGSVKKTVSLGGADTISSFAGIGMTLSSRSSDPGLTSVTRTSDSIRPGSPHSAVKRYYSVVPTNTVGIQGTVQFRISNNELNGRNPANLDLWQSTNNGQTWRSLRGTPLVDANGVTMIKYGVQNYGGLWTAADRNIATKMNILAGANQHDTVTTTLVPFSVKLLGLPPTLDPVEGLDVHFRISSMPHDSSKAMISDTLVFTDAAGVASTTLKLGTKVGQYVVEARAIGLNDTVMLASFIANATPGLPVTFANLGGSGQYKEVNSILDTAFQVAAMDVNDNFVVDSTVTFRIDDVPVTARNHQLSVTSIKTDSNGKAITVLKLGNRTGWYKVIAQIQGATALRDTFLAYGYPGAPRYILSTLGDKQKKPVKTALDTALVVTVTDSSGNPISDIQVDFALTSFPSGTQGQRIIQPSLVTNAEGRDSALLTFGNKIGIYKVRATSPSLSDTVFFILTAKPGPLATMLIYSSAQLSGPVNKWLTQPFQAILKDSSGNPTVDQPVTFSVITKPDSAINDSLNPTQTLVDSSGLAAVRMKVGSKVGDYILKASSRRLVPDSMFSVLFHVKGTAGIPKEIALTLGHLQKDTINSTLDSAFVATVYDDGRNPVIGRNLVFELAVSPDSAVGQSINIKSGLTDTLGRVSTTLTLGNKVGFYTVRARIPDLNNDSVQADFKAKALAGTPVRILAAKTGTQVKPICTQLDTPFSITLYDIGENLVPNVPMRFSISQMPADAALDSMNMANVLTDTLGQASSFLVLGDKIGTYTVTAFTNIVNNDVEQLPPPSRRKLTAVLDEEAGAIALATNNQADREAVEAPSPIYTTFTARAIPGLAAAVAKTIGNGQVKSVSAWLDTNLALKIVDKGGNGVPNVRVAYSVSGVPIQDAAGQKFAADTVRSDSTGWAKTFFRLGNWPGQYQVTARPQGLSDTLFSASAFMRVGDPNRDANINVADLTMIIDYINRRVGLKAEEFRSADVNSDSLLDERDVRLVLETLLSDTSLAYQGDTPPPFASLPSGPGFIKPMKSIQKIEAVDTVSGPVSGLFDITPQGLRFNLTNSIQVQGLQVKVRYRSAQTADKPEHIYKRGEMMEYVIQPNGTRMSIVGYNMTNQPIDTGSGTIIRLPVYLNSAAEIESIQVITSVKGNIASVTQAKAAVAQPGTYPVTYRLAQNYPNPFNAGTTIQFDLPEAGPGRRRVVVQVFNMLGQRVRTLLNGDVDAGTFTIYWNGRDDAGRGVASGVYLYRLISKDFTSTKKMVLVR